jgi:hypothetical protein
MKRALLGILILLFTARSGVAATFGTTDIGGTTSAASDEIYGCSASPTYNGSATSMTAYLAGWGSGEKIKYALYDASDDSYIATTEEGSAGGGTDWHTLNFSSSVTIYSSTTYLLAIWSDSTVTFYYAAAAGQEYPADNEAYNGWPDPLTTNTEWAFSVYCTYTPVTTVAGTRSRYSNDYRSSYRNRYN